MVTMKKMSPVPVIAFLMALLVLTSSVGIAQVSHICRMALAGMEQNACSENITDEHPCCMDDAAPVSGSKEDPCCSNQVKVFSQKVISTVPGTGNPVSFEAREISLLTYPVLFAESASGFPGSSYPVSSVLVPDTGILLFNCTLLI